MEGIRGEVWELTPYAKPAAWMVKEYKYDPEEVQCRTLTRPAGIYEAVMSQLGPSEDRPKEGEGILISNLK